MASGQVSLVVEDAAPSTDIPPDAEDTTRRGMSAKVFIVVYILFGLGYSLYMNNIFAIYTVLIEDNHHDGSIVFVEAETEEQALDKLFTHENEGEDPENQIPRELWHEGQSFVVQQFDPTKILK